MLTFAHTRLVMYKVLFNIVNHCPLLKFRLKELSSPASTNFGRDYDLSRDTNLPSLIVTYHATPCGWQASSDLVLNYAQQWALIKKFVLYYRNVVIPVVRRLSSIKVDTVISVETALVVF